MEWDTNPKAHITKWPLMFVEAITKLFGFPPLSSIMFSNISVSFSVLCYLYSLACALLPHTSTCTTLLPEMTLCGMTGL